MEHQNKGLKLNLPNDFLICDLIFLLRTVLMDSSSFYDFMLLMHLKGYLSCTVCVRVHVCPFQTADFEIWTWPLTWSDHRWKTAEVREMTPVQIFDCQIKHLPDIRCRLISTLDREIPEIQGNWGCCKISLSTHLFYTFILFIKLHFNMPLM